MNDIKVKKHSALQIYPCSVETVREIPVVSFWISAGFPSPALDFIDDKIDLNKYLIKRPAATFFGKVSGDSMNGAGINDGDVLIIDRSLQPENNKLAVCSLDSEFTVKRLEVKKTGLWLMPENQNYQPIKIDELNDLRIWGITTFIIKAVP